MGDAYEAMDALRRPDPEEDLARVAAECDKYKALWEARGETILRIAGERDALQAKVREYDAMLVALLKHRPKPRHLDEAIALRACEEGVRKTTFLFRSLFGLEAGDE